MEDDHILNKPTVTTPVVSSLFTIIEDYNQTKQFLVIRYMITNYALKCMLDSCNFLQ